MTRLDRFLSSRWTDLIVAAILVFIVLAVLCGCSATKAIGHAAGKATQEATTGSQALAVADTTLAAAESEPDPERARELIRMARGLISKAKDGFDRIIELASGIVDRINSGDVKDAEWGLITWLKRFWYLAMAVMLAVLGVMYAPLRHLLNTIGSWFVSLIPRAIKVDAEADAELIAANETGAVKATTKQVAAIQEKKRDPRYKKILDKELVARKVAT